VASANANQRGREPPPPTTSVASFTTMARIERNVTDPRGVAWHLRLEWEMVSTLK